MSADTGLQRIQIEPIAPAVETPKGDAEHHDYVSELYDEGRWDKIIEFTKGFIAEFVQKLPNPMLSNTEVVDLFFASEAYKARGESDKHAACLKMLYSLEPFKHSLGANYRKYVDTGVEEYLALSKEVGEDQLNQLDVTGLFKKKSGCFIATACYGSNDAPEVLALRSFRDEVLLKVRFGKTLVQFYYLVSPTIANFITKRRTLKDMIRLLLIKPLVSLIRRYDRGSL